MDASREKWREMKCFLSYFGFLPLPFHRWCECECKDMKKKKAQSYSINSSSVVSSHRIELHSRDDAVLWRHHLCLSVVTVGFRHCLVVRLMYWPRHHPSACRMSLSSCQKPQQQQQRQEWAILPPPPPPSHPIAISIRICFHWHWHWCCACTRVVFLIFLSN